jgi:hypothetical protein
MVVLVPVQPDLVSCICDIADYIRMVFDNPTNDKENCLRRVLCKLVEDEPGTFVHIEWHFMWHAVGTLEVETH